MSKEELLKLQQAITTRLYIISYEEEQELFKKNLTYKDKENLKIIMKISDALLNNKDLYILDEPLNLTFEKFRKLFYITDLGKKYDNYENYSKVYEIYCYLQKEAFIEDLHETPTKIHVKYLPDNTLEITNSSIGRFNRLKSEFCISRGYDGNEKIYLALTLLESKVDEFEFIHQYFTIDFENLSNSY